MAEIQVKEVEPMTVMSLSFTGPYEQTREKLEGLMSWLLRIGHPYSAPPMGLYYDDPAKVAADALRAEVCLPIEEKCEPADEMERKELPGATVACAVHEGPFGELHQVYQQVFAWAEENGYRYVEGLPTREVFHVLPGQEEDPTHCVTEVQVPVEKAGQDAEEETAEVGASAEGSGASSEEGP
ncbi:MAG: GyrI-like domain-containing protein [Candidatus Brocadiae bacterium]|nr:GyrI-like domain-containing protein [Candidatus Brocadiia bacterium]